MPSSHGAPRTGLTHDGGPRWQTFVPRPRREAVHTQRPADVALPPSRAFSSGCLAAASLRPRGQSRSSIRHSQASRSLRWSITPRAATSRGGRATSSATSASLAASQSSKRRASAACRWFATSFDNRYARATPYDVPDGLVGPRPSPKYRRSESSCGSRSRRMRAIAPGKYGRPVAAVASGAQRHVGASHSPTTGSRHGAALVRKSFPARGGRRSNRRHEGHPMARTILLGRAAGPPAERAREVRVVRISEVQREVENFPVRRFEHRRCRGEARVSHQHVVAHPRCREATLERAEARPKKRGSFPQRRIALATRQRFDGVSHRSRKLADVAASTVSMDSPAPATA